MKCGWLCYFEACAMIDDNNRQRFGSNRTEPRNRGLTGSVRVWIFTNGSVSVRFGSGGYKFSSVRFESSSA